MYHAEIVPGQELRDDDPSQTGIGTAGSPHRDLQRSLTQLAAGLDTRFVQAGTTLMKATEAIGRVVAALDRVTSALDEDAAEAAVGSLSTIAGHLGSIPELQAVRGAELATVMDCSVKLRGGVMEMRQALYVLRIYGVNIKIAASGALEFVQFVDGMATELGAGEQQLETILDMLNTLSTGVATAQQAERLLAAECAKVVPQVPRKLVSDASDLRTHLAAVSGVARRVKAIAQEVQGRVAVVLGALQVGDSTRQRIEHAVAALQLLDTWRTEQQAEPAIIASVVGHIYRLLSAQMEAVSLDFEQGAEMLVSALAALGPEAAKLLALIEEEQDDDGRAFLQRLERGITEVEQVTFQLNATDVRLGGMVGAITETLDALKERFESLHRIRFDVQNIAINTRLLCRRFGMIGRAVAIVAKEIDISAAQLHSALVSVGEPIQEMMSVTDLMRQAQSSAGQIKAGEALAEALATIRGGCQRTEQGVNEGRDDARQVIEMLCEAEDGLKSELALGDKMKAASESLAAFAGPEAELIEAACEPLQGLLSAMSRLYTMKQERDIHARFLLPGSETTSAGASSNDGLFDDDDDDDGLF